MWPDSLETDRLLESARNGDAASINRLLERHRAALVRLVSLRLDPGVRRRVDASDVVQDVLAEAARRLADYLREPAAPFHLWLRQMARDRMVDAYRRHRAAARRSLDREQPLAAPELDDRSALDLAAQLRDHRELTPAAAAVRHELDRRFAEAVDALDDLDREVILMRHFEHLTNQEVARSLGLSEPAAGMRYLRAMRRLRARLDVAPGDSQEDGRDGRIG